MTQTHLIFKILIMVIIVISTSLFITPAMSIILDTLGFKIKTAGVIDLSLCITTIVLLLWSIIKLLNKMFKL